MQITFLGSSLLNPLKSGLISNSECLKSASLLSKIFTYSLNVLAILKEVIVVIILNIKNK